MSSAPDAAVIPADSWVIEPRQYGVVDRARELWAYRYLWWYFAANAIRDMYRKSMFGWLWLLMRVAGPVGLSALIFGGVLSVPSEGTPYFLFFLCGTTTWVLFERSLLVVTRSIEGNRRLITKVYFPRLILPMSSVAPGLMYLSILLVTMLVSLGYYYQRDGVWYVQPSPRLFVSVAAILLSLTFAISVGLWTSVLQARYRDVRYGLRYAMPFWFYFTPVIYPLSHIPEKWRWVVAVNPMATIVEMYKWGTLGQGSVTATGVATSLSLIALTFTLGMWFFNREEAASIDKL
jgi:lipopolysaccharide transport system permease protein